MPRASELEEFGLEVEHERLVPRASDVESSLPKRSRQAASLGAITKTLGSKANKSRINFKPGMLKWALLVIVLAIAAVYHLGKESEETQDDIAPQDLEAKTEVFEKGGGDWDNEDGGDGLHSVDETPSRGEDIEESEHHSADKIDAGSDAEKEKSDENAGEISAEVEAESLVHDSEENDVSAEMKGSSIEQVGEDDEATADAGNVQEHKKQLPEEASGEEVSDASEKEKENEVDAVGGNADESVETEEESSVEKSEPDAAPTASDMKEHDEASDNSGTFTLERLQATRKAANSLIEMLEKYYYGKETATKMFNSWLDPWDFDPPANETAKRERLDKVVDTMARALVTEEQKEFLIGTIGSSVAAGHDNCHYDSYESQLERTFGPVWEAAGMKFVNQNGGEGGGCGDDFRNQIYCIKQNVSPNIDIAHYTWTYFEVGSEAWGHREMLIRWIQMLPRQPPLHVINVQLYPSEYDGLKQELEVIKHYAKYGFNAYYIREGYIAGGYDYATEEANGTDRFGWGYVGDGYHNVTRYGENEENPDRKESLGVVMRNWHPGPLVFQLLSDALSYVYSKAMLLALDLIEKDMIEGKDPRETWSASKRKIITKKSLPEPKYCDPEYCVVDEAPGCLNFELPTFGVWGARVENPNDNLNPHKGELQNWEMWHEDDGFWHQVGRQDTAIFQDRDDKEICKHLDACGGISASSADNGMVVFRLPKMEVGLVAICGCCGKEASDMFINNTGLEIQYNGAKLDSSTWDVFPTRKCVRLLKRFPTQGAAASTPTGHAYLSVKALDGLSSTVRISHVITL